MATVKERAPTQLLEGRTVPCPNQFTINGQKVEIARTSNIPHYEDYQVEHYENKCFAGLEHEPTPSVIFGPRLTHTLFEPLNTRGLDGIRFETADPERWTLTGLYEFCASTHSRANQKLESFSQLLFLLRTQPRFLPDLLAEMLGTTLEIPKEIIIPPDREITAFLVRPTAIRNPTGQTPAELATEFTVRYKHVAEGRSTFYGGRRPGKRF